MVDKQQSFAEASESPDAVSETGETDFPDSAKPQMPRPENTALKLKVYGATADLSRDKILRAMLAMGLGDDPALAEGSGWGWNDWVDGQGNFMQAVMPCPLCKGRGYETPMYLSVMPDGSVAVECFAGCSTRSLDTWLRENGVDPRVPKRPRVAGTPEERVAQGEWAPNANGAAWRLLKAKAPLLMLVRQDVAPSEVLSLMEHGAWSPNWDDLTQMHAEVCKDWEERAIAEQKGGGLSFVDCQRFVKHLRSIITPSGRASTITMCGSAAQEMTAAGVEMEGLTRIIWTQLDREKRYLACGNGIVDLDSGELMPPEEAKHTYTQYRTGAVDYHPDARHEAVDKLFDHLHPERAAYLQACLGRALWGQPDVGYLMIVGEGRSGKSTLLKALLSTLAAPSHAAILSEDAVRPSSTKGKTGPTEEKITLSKVRYAVCEEAADWRISPERLKDYTGGLPHIVVQPKFGSEITLPLTATIIFTANKMPRLSLDDPALANRLRVVIYEQPKEPDPSVKAAFTENDPSAREAMLALLVRLAVANPPGREVEIPPTVRQDIDDAVLNNQTEFQLWLGSNIEKGEAVDFVCVDMIWEAWAYEHDREASSDEIMGQAKARVSDVFRNRFHPEPARSCRYGEKMVRGWKGYKMRLSGGPPCVSCGQPSDTQGGRCSRCVQQQLQGLGI